MCLVCVVINKRSFEYFMCLVYVIINKRSFEYFMCLDPLFLVSRFLLPVDG